MESRLTFAEVLRNIKGYYGVRSSSLQKIGVFTIVWGMFESELELTVLTVAKEEMSKDKRPSTDAKHIDDLIKSLREKSAQLEKSICNVSKVMCDAAGDLLVLRNAISHGWIVPSKSGGIGFINNPKWLNVKRKRDTTEVCLTDQLLEEVIEAVSILRECSMRLRQFVGGLEGYPAKYVTELASEVDRARRIASGLNVPTVTNENSK